MGHPITRPLDLSRFSCLVPSGTNYPVYGVIAFEDLGVGPVYLIKLQPTFH